MNSAVARNWQGGGGADEGVEDLVISKHGRDGVGAAAVVDERADGVQHTAGG
jgi:hypothetical protein